MRSSQNRCKRGDDGGPEREAHRSPLEDGGEFAMVKQREYGMGDRETGLQLQHKCEALIGLVGYQSHYII